MSRCSRCSTAAAEAGTGLWPAGQDFELTKIRKLKIVEFVCEWARTEMTLI